MAQRYSLIQKIYDSCFSTMSCGSIRTECEYMISGKYFFKGKIFFSVFLVRFIDVATAEKNTLLTQVIPLLKGGGKVLFSDSPGGPLPHGFEALLGQGLARQLPFDGCQQEEVLWSEVRGGCSMSLKSLAAIHSFTTVSVLSQWRNHSLASIVGRFLLKSSSGPPQWNLHRLCFAWAHSSCR